MRAQLLLVVAIVVAVKSLCREINYERLGCFSSCPPYGRTKERWVPRLPWAPQIINTRFLLFTRKNPDQFQEVSALNVSTVLDTKFSCRRKSHFIIHGFLAGGEDEWPVDMCRTLLQVSDVNCFSVDWHGGSAALYSQAANNARVVGAELAYFIDYLLNQFGYPLSNTYLIGHSLGAHVAGEAGKRRPGIARITGLDPAGPYFEDTPIEVRLDPSDAALVDVIHTDGTPAISHLGFGGYGTSQLLGHLDFFPNGGMQMPGCPNPTMKTGDNLDNVIEDVGSEFTCNHQMSHVFFLKSILRPDGFVGYPASSYSAFQEGAGFPCYNTSCALMGYYADAYTQEDADANTQDSTQFFLNTGDAEGMLRRWIRRTLGFVGLEALVLGLGFKGLEVPGDGQSHWNHVFYGIVECVSVREGGLFSSWTYSPWENLLLPR
ncbi:inactive pancreatic lipase-related protein 1-like [Dendropsophus ebraccatus]|uniref:inactive pancreatic lipase-related protein 1-like n=1 Tax=Dendropsophus ebraccatus TaxID=150705 RepID=UPI003831D997